MVQKSGLVVLVAGIALAAVGASSVLATSPGSGSRPTTPPATSASPPSTTTPKPAPKPSMRELLRKGYEIMAVTVMAPDVLSAMGNDPKNPQILVTLQKDQKIAACQYSAGNWTSLATSSIEGTTQCDYYPK